MPFRILNLPPGSKGRVFLGSMPGRGRPYPEEVEEIRREGISVVVRLTGDRETSLRSPEYWEAIRSGNLAWKEIPYPISDYGIPADLRGFRRFMGSLLSRLAEGRSILVHCRAGIGRTGLVAAAILVDLGLGLDEALLVVGQAGSHAEEEAQVNFLEAYSQGQRP